MKTFRHNGETWQATSVGSEGIVEGQHSMTVRFVCPATGAETVGRLPRVASERFSQATDEQLEDALAEALYGSEDAPLGISTSCAQCGQPNRRTGRKRNDVLDSSGLGDVRASPVWEEEVRCPNGHVSWIPLGDDEVARRRLGDR